MTSILRQDASGLTLYESENPYPVNGEYESNFAHWDRVKQWFADARKFPCKDVEKFIELAADINKTYGKTTIILQRQGIQIKSDCYFKKCEVNEKTNELIEYVFFKQPTPPPVNEAVYTIDDMKNCFNESRLANPFIGFKHDNFEAYIKYKTQP